MAAFTTFGTTLPTPTITINYAGQQAGAGAVPGPGYASLKIEGEYKNIRDLTNSGRLVSRGAAYHQWLVDITYNPMTRAEFSPVYSFLLEKQGQLRPFFVTLPQYASSQNASFSSTLAFVADVAAGRTYFEVDTANLNGQPPRPGDMFTINDAGDSNHTKAYKVTRVETSTDFNNTTGYGALGANNLRIHCTPPLQRYTYNNAELVFTNPEIKVVMADDLVSYQLKTDNLYVFSLSLEEVQ